MTELNTRSFIDSASLELSNLKEANKKLSEAILTYSKASVDVEKLKHIIDGKKNNLINSGMIAGKNADERAASAWLAISEYDNLAEAEATLIVAKNMLNIAEIASQEAKSALSLQSQILSVVNDMNKSGM